MAAERVGAGLSMHCTFSLHASQMPRGHPKGGSTDLYPLSLAISLRLRGVKGGDVHSREAPAAIPICLLGPDLLGAASLPAWASFWWHSPLSSGLSFNLPQGSFCRGENGGESHTHEIGHRHARYTRTGTFPCRNELSPGNRLHINVCMKEQPV